MAQDTKVFINYRQIDCSPLADHLARTFKERLNGNSFFLDKETIGYGKSITDEIRQHLNSTEALVVLIGPNWHWVQNQDGDKRLLNSDDWVRREIEIAAEKNKLVVPVLYNDANHASICDWLKRKVPSLAFLEDLKCFHISEKTLESDTQRLLDYLEAELQLKLQPATVPAPISEQQGAKRELEQHFPIAQDYRMPTAKVPFLGLEYFKKAEAALFFGRAGETLKLCRAVQNFDLILLYGHSGVGKSSLLNAGLLSRLEPYYPTQYLRRDKTVGYHRQTEALLQGKNNPSERRLIILDQVEELYTDPRPDKNQEIDAFAAHIRQLLPSGCKIILGFRSEYFPDIRDALRQEQLLITEAQELHLHPLSREGVKEAITGLVDDPALKSHYRLKIEEELVTEMTRDLLTNQSEEAHIGPLMQYQLRQLWDKAAAARSKSTDWLKLTAGQYRSSRKATLDELLDDQLSALQPKWEGYLKKGLVLDVLYSYTTNLLTATSQSDATVLSRYQHISDFPELFADLKHRSYLLIPGGTEAQPASRLAHDALAPLLRERYRNSDAPAQRAQRIVETKAREIRQGFPTRFSETDIETIVGAQQAMQKVPEEVLEKMKDDQKRYEKQKQDRFHLAFDTAAKLIENLNYEDALNRLRVSSYERIHWDLVYELAAHLPFYFAERAQTDLLRESLQFLQRLSEENDTKLEAILAATKSKGADVKSLLQDWMPQLSRKMEQRHFPMMLEITGGRFSMGSEEGYVDEKPVHEVSVSTFLLADTPVTCWQYGLFCQETEKALPNDSGFGRGDKPVVNVNWIDAVKYCNWLSERQGLDKVYTIDPENEEQVSADWEKSGYRLPTEAEWEYAARGGAQVRMDAAREGGKDIRFGNGKNVADPAEMNFDASHPYNKQNPNWYIAGKGYGGTTPVKKFAPNALGLYDMSGNVFEWCWDKWSEGKYYKQSEGAKNPTGPEETSEPSRVVRGGSWHGNASDCRCSYRYRGHPINQNIIIGFRVARRL